MNTRHYYYLGVDTEAAAEVDVDDDAEMSAAADSCASGLNAEPIVRVPVIGDGTSCGRLTSEELAAVVDDAGDAAAAAAAAALLSAASDGDTMFDGVPSAAGVSGVELPAGVVTGRGTS